jgi:histidinol-phosphatase (PHP family)
MINAVKPAVVGHFDLVRLYDNNYRERIKRTEIAERIDRNLARIAELGLILDFNVRALFRGAREPYITKRILQKACDMGIAVVPGDDSHGVDTVGLNLEKGIQLLKKMGFTTDWKKPVSVRSSNVL